MNSEKTALLGFQLAKFVMMLGTAAMAVLITEPLVADLPGVVQGVVVFFVVSVIVLLLDGGGWDFVVDAGRALNKQDHNRPGLLTTLMMLFFGLTLIFGSAFLSVMTSPILSRVTTADKSGEAERLERVTSQAQKNYLALLQNSSKSVERAEAAYNEAKSRYERREKDAPSAIGGKLGQDLRDGNEWARKQRPYTSFIAGREKEYKDALATLAQAQQAHNALVSRGFQDETTQAVVDGIGVVLADWQAILSEKKNIFFGVQVSACAVALFFAFLLFRFQALPNDRTMLQVGRDLALTISNAIVLALDFGQVHASRAIDEKTRALHIIAPGTIQDENVQSRQGQTGQNTEGQTQGQTGQNSGTNCGTNCGTNTGCAQGQTKDENVQPRQGQNRGQKQKSLSRKRMLLSQLSPAERHKYNKYKNRLLKGRLGDRAKQWFDSIENA